MGRSRARDRAGDGQQLARDQLVIGDEPAVIAVAPGLTLDAVLDRLRQAPSDTVILDVDERSPLFISLQHLHQLDEVAQERELQVTIASASSKLLNAARVFGLATLDRRVVTDDVPAPWEDATSPLPDGAVETPVDASAAEADGGLDETAEVVRPAPRLDPYGQPYAAEDRAPEAAVAGEEWDEADGADAEPAPGGFFARARDWAVARLATRREEPLGSIDGERAVPRVADDDGWAALPDDAGEPGAPEEPVAPRRAPVAVVAPPVADEFAPSGEEEAWSDEAVPAWASDDRRRWNGWFAYVVVGLLLLVALVGVGFYYLFASATVTLVARTGSVTTAFNVVVAEIDPNSPQGQPTTERIVAPAKRITVPVSASATVSATGYRLEPDLTAGGPVLLSNASTGPVAVPKGTVLTATDGRTYVLLEGATVPPADPFNAAAFGTVTVKVAAAAPGSAGNAGVGVVRGQLPSGIFYNNRSAPIAGGSDRKIPVIAKDDLARAQAAAEAAAREKGPGALAAALPPGSTVMKDTTGVDKFKVEFSAAEGADGDAVSATATGEATALTYNPADVAARAQPEVAKRLAAGVSPGEAIVPGSLTVAAPVLTAETPGVLTYRVTGTARTRAAIGGDRERAQLQHELAGQSDDRARAILQALPGVSSFTIAYAPSWLPAHMPWRASRVTIRVAEPAR